MHRWTTAASIIAEQYGCTPLILGAVKGNHKLVGLCLNRGADPNANDEVSHEGPWFARGQRRTHGRSETAGMPSHTESRRQARTPRRATDTARCSDCVNAERVDTANQRSRQWFRCSVDVATQLQSEPRGQGYGLPTWRAILGPENGNAGAMHAGSLLGVEVGIGGTLTRVVQAGRSGMSTRSSHQS